MENKIVVLNDLLMVCFYAPTTKHVNKKFEFPYISAYPS